MRQCHSFLTPFLVQAEEDLDMCLRRFSLLKHGKRLLVVLLAKFSCFVCGCTLSTSHCTGAPVQQDVPKTTANQTANERANLAPPLGTVEGTIVFAGDAPEVRYIGPVMPRTAKRILDTSIKVKGTDHRLANVFVYLLNTPELLDKVKSLRLEAPRPRQLTIRDGSLVPRVLCLTEGQPLLVANEDQENYKFILLHSRKKTPVLVRLGEIAMCDFGFEGSMPDTLLASNFSWMRGAIFVTKHPLAAVTDTEGRFFIRNIPYGKWDLSLWHERVGLIVEVIIGEATTRLQGGRLPVEVSTENKSLGTIALPSRIFTK